MQFRNTYFIATSIIIVSVLLFNTQPSFSKKIAPKEESFYNGLTNKDIKRVIDIRSNLEEDLYEIEVENTGKKNAGFYLLPILAEKFAHFSFSTASGGTHAPFATSLVKVKESELPEGFPAGTALLKVEFPQPLAPGATITIQVVLIFTHTLQPYPAQITQYEDQKVQFFDNHYILSPYLSEKQASQVKLASSNIESRSTEKPTKTNKDVIEYGPYKDVKPFTYSKLHVHYENNIPFVTITNCIREVEVSHWGNVAFEETYDLKHTGAALKGTFSRLDYQRGQGQNSKSSFRTITATLPAGVKDIYYRDNIGNISTSHVRKGRDGTVFEVSPRFPMFGGWKTDFYVGYSIRSQRVLYQSANDPNTYVLNISFSTAFTQAAVDSLTLRVILPEGANDIRYISPFSVDEERDTRFTYLDTTGRPVIVLSKENLSRFHNQHIQVVYTFTKTAIYHKPVMMVVGFFLFYISCIILMRLELSISSKKISIRRHGVVGELVNTLLDKFQLFETALTKNETEKINTLLKELLNGLAEIKKHDVSLGDITEKLEDSLNKLKLSRAPNATKGANKYQQTLGQVESLLSDLAGL